MTLNSRIRAPTLTRGSGLIGTRQHHQCTPGLRPLCDDLPRISPRHQLDSRTMQSLPVMAMGLGALVALHRKRRRKDLGVIVHLRSPKQAAYGAVPCSILRHRSGSLAKPGSQAALGANGGHPLLLDARCHPQPHPGSRWRPAGSRCAQVVPCARHRLEKILRRARGMNSRLGFAGLRAGRRWCSSGGAAVLFERDDGGIARITLNEPRRRNVLSRCVRAALVRNAGLPSAHGPAGRRSRRFMAQWSP